MDYLTRGLGKMSELPDSHFHPMCKAIKLTHLIFADDLMLFCKGDVASINRMMEVLNHFSAVSRLLANIDKFNIFLARMDEECKQEILNCIGFSLGSLPIRYLGLPFSSKKWSKVECHALVEKITKRVCNGYSKLLSYAGRIQIINVVLFSIYNFWGAVFILPQSVVKSIDRICRDYLWGNSIGHKKVSLVAIKKDVLWVKWVNEVYMKSNHNIWEHQPPQDCSWYWKKLNALKEIMAQWYTRGVYQLTTSGLYYVSSSYIVLKGNITTLREPEVIWNAVMLPRQRVITWLAFQDKLMTKERPMRLNIPINEDINCIVCDCGEPETHQHLFVDCSWTQNIRVALLNWSGITIPSYVSRSLQWIKNRHWRQFRKEVAAAIIGAIIYYSWQARNWKHFRKTNVNNASIEIQIKKELRERISMLAGSRRARNCPILVQRICS
ncbi:PREDICTED: uncharacterized protein LOC109224322 [Nicotiana attenuata]|uniref:uncharacterized protein LOC109224322 n=1 Tax=Nicotiana attenuata TaxID=49451 RepID=UPI0009053A44|nr:PREDICTED: uncharacterized protein LOC109224322 [Nicotiana attenuata]